MWQAALNWCKLYKLQNNFTLNSCSTLLLGSLGRTHCVKHGTLFPTSEFSSLNWPYLEGNLWLHSAQNVHPSDPFSTQHPKWSPHWHPLTNQPPNTICGGLNENDPTGSKEVALLEMWTCWSRCGFVGTCASLGVGFEVSDAQARPSVALLFLLPADPDVELSAASPVPCLPTCHHGSHHDNNGLNLWTVRHLQLNVFCYKSCHGHGVSSQQKKP